MASNREGTSRVQAGFSIGVASQEVLAAGVGHGKIQIDNQSANIIYYKYGGTAVADSTCGSIPANTRWESQTAISTSVSLIASGAASACNVESDA